MINHQITCLTKLTSHPPTSLLLRLETFQSKLPGGGQVTGRNVKGLGIQGLEKIATFSPDPILHLTLASNNFRPQRMLLHTYDGLEPIRAFKKSQCGKYLALSTRESKLFSLYNNSHPCFANIAWMKASKSQKPISPSAFGKHSFSQLHYWIFCPFASPPHQNLTTILCNSLHKELGNRKIPIVYVSIAISTAFIKTSCPLTEKR